MCGEPETGIEFDETQLELSYSAQIKKLLDTYNSGELPRPHCNAHLRYLEQKFSLGLNYCRGVISRNEYFVQSKMISGNLQLRLAQADYELDQSSYTVQVDVPPAKPKPPSLEAIRTPRRKRASKSIWRFK